MVTICAYYKFIALPKPEEVKAKLLRFCKSQKIKGLTLLGEEGINGTMAGTDTAMTAFRTFVGDTLGIAAIDWKLSYADAMPFMRLKVKVKSEIVTSGVAHDADPFKGTGTYLEPDEWNAVISQDDAIVVDVRNDFEVQMGTFKNARNPHTTSFREFAAYVDTELAPYKDKPIAMCCTGGIRCEKSTAYLRSKGFSDVYHLKGGILRYLEEMPEEKSLWKGECFVFDSRVSVDHSMKPGMYALCHGCRFPINAADRLSPGYEEGVTCPRCVNIRTDEQKSRARERQHQLAIARTQQRLHMGDPEELCHVTTANTVNSHN